MRAVKSVLVMAGQLKRENPDLSEDVTLIRALRDSNLPKFLYDDVPLFMAIIQVRVRVALTLTLTLRCVPGATLSGALVSAG